MNSGHRLFTAHRRPSCTVPAITGLDIMAVAGDDDGNDIGVGRLGYIAARPRDVRCYPKSGQNIAVPRMTRCAICGFRTII